MVGACSITPADTDHRHVRLAPAEAGKPPGGCEALPRIAGYRLRRRVGQGRTSTAYLAQDLRRGEEVVLKVMERDAPPGRQRSPSFAGEFSVPAGISSDHVIRVFDQFVDGGFACIAMEYLAGGHLGDRIRGGVEPASALALLRQAAVALADLHRHGFAHCDVKPANLLLRSCGTLVLADFGLARRLDAAQPASPAGAIVGTPLYAAPEQSQGGAIVAASDVYSLGVVFHEMLCGRPPFAGPTALEVCCQHLLAAVPELPQELAGFQPLVDRMMEKRIEQRLPDGQAVLDQIDLLLKAAGEVQAAPAGISGSRCLS